MIQMNRRNTVTAITATLLTSLFSRSAKAQFTEQEVRNGARITSTGDVTLEQSASGDQMVEVEIDGEWVSEDGIYQDGTTQVIVNDGRVTSTGDVNVRQSASGNQRVQTQVEYYDGVPASRCQVGAVIADPHGKLYYQRDDCCWYAVPCCVEKKRGCEGDFCG